MDNSSSREERQADSQIALVGGDGEGDENSTTGVALGHAKNAVVPADEEQARKAEAEKEVDIYDRSNVSLLVSLVPALFTGGADYFGLGSIGPLLPYFVSARGEVDDWVGYVQSIDGLLFVAYLPTCLPA